MDKSAKGSTASPTGGAKTHIPAASCAVGGIEQEISKDFGHLLSGSLRAQNRTPVSTAGRLTVLGYDRRNLAMSIAMSPREIATIAVPAQGLSRTTTTPITTPRPQNRICRTNTTGRISGVGTPPCPP